MKVFLFALVVSFALVMPAMADKPVPSSTDDFRRIAGERQYSRVFVWPMPQLPEPEKVRSSTDDFRASAGSRSYYQFAFSARHQDDDGSKTVLSSTDDFRAAAGRAQYSGWCFMGGDRSTTRVATSGKSR